MLLEHGGTNIPWGNLEDPERRWPGFYECMAPDGQRTGLPTCGSEEKSVRDE